MNEEWLITLGNIGHELLLMALFMPLILVVFIGGLYVFIRRVD